MSSKKTPAKRSAPRKARSIDKPKKTAAVAAATPGVFDVIRAALASAKGAGVTKAEIHAQLVKAHPERNPDSMLRTLGIQLSRQKPERTHGEDGVIRYRKGKAS